MAEMRREVKSGLWFIYAVGLVLTALPALGQPLPTAESECVRCHSYAVRKTYLKMLQEWEESVHAAKGVDCSDCHGGNPRAKDPHRAMEEAGGFRSHFRKAEIPALCGKCHSDPLRMRPFGIPIGQDTEYRTSVHGKRLLQGDEKVAVCTDCHGVHLVRPVKDPRSPVFRTNIPKTCAKCHADSKYMAGYRRPDGRPLPTNQFSTYSKSVHGRALLKEGQLKAPACADCHGSHGATPPKVKEIPDVCGQCHPQEEENFNLGAHRVALESAAKRPRCVDCHGTHDIAVPDDQMLLNSREGYCGHCHKPGSEGYKVSQEMHTFITRGQTEYDRAEALLNRTKGVAEEARAALQRAHAGLRQARSLQHAVSTEAVRKAVEDARLEIRKAAEGGEMARAAQRQKRYALLAVAIVCVFIAAIVLKKRMKHAG